MHGMGAQTVLVDGALSRLSLASPAVTDGMILASGAALCPDIDAIVKKTAFICRLIEIPKLSTDWAEKLIDIEKGVWTVSEDGEIFDTGIDSALHLEKLKSLSLNRQDMIFICGVVTDKMMRFLAQLALHGNLRVIVRDFTRLFVQPDSFAAFTRSGAELRVLQKPTLLGVTVNPWSPRGFTVNPSKLQLEMQKRVQVPVINVRAC